MNPQEQADQLELLQVEFNTIDSSLVAAILNDTDNVELARETLNIIKLEAIVDDGSSQGGNQSCPEWGDWSDGTDPTTLSLSSWRISEDDDDGEEGEVPGDKVGYLAKMFPKQTQYTIKNTLDKCQGDLERATDELLNRVFLSEDLEESTVRGVDGFDVGLSGKRGKKKRRKGKGKGTVVENHLLLDRHRTASLPNDDSDSVTTQSRWESMSREIKHLASSLHLPEKTVQSVYHRHHGSIPPTLTTLIETHATPTISLDPTHLNQLHELSSEFGADVKLEHLATLLTLCKDNTPAVFEFAEILRNATTKLTIKINTTSLNAPPPSRSAHTATNGWVTVGGSSASSTSPTYSPPISPRTPSRPLATLAAQTTARNEAFQKAAASYRKSKSNPLMGGAAAFYSGLGRTHDQQIRSLRDEAAESLVNENSSVNVLDLHGVTVPQAVRIAKERTTDWWVRQMRERELAGGGGGAGWGKKAVVPFHIVTGLGRHSRGGVPQLLPAVTRMLMKDGWKVVVEQGHVVVYGVKGR